MKENIAPTLAFMTHAGIEVILKIAKLADFQKSLLPFLYP